MDQPRAPSRKYRHCGTTARACDAARRVAWLKQCQNKQQADAVDTRDTSENVSVTDSNVESREVEATEVEPNSVPNNVYACDQCDYPTHTEHGLNVHREHKHKPANSTPEKEPTSSFQGDLSLTLTPAKEITVEKCGNCGVEMT